MRGKLQISRKIAISTFIVASASGVQWLLWPLIEPAPFILFYPSIILATLYGEGISAIILSALIAQFFFVPPPFDFAVSWPTDALRQTIFLVSATMIRQITKSLSMAIDVASEERRRTQEAELWLKTTLSSIGDAVITVDRGGRVTFMNPVAEALTEWSSNEACGRPLQDIFIVVDRNTLAPKENSVSQVWATGETVGSSEHAMIIGRHGKKTTIEDKAAPIRVSSGAEPQGVVLVFRDTSAKYLQEKQLAEAYGEARHGEIRMSSILENALDAVVGMDDQGLVTHWNSQAEMIFGYSADDAIGKRMSELIVPIQHREAHERGMRRYLATGAGPVLNRRIEITAIRQNGLEFPIELSITPIKMGEHISFAAFIRDISDQQRLKNELLTSKDAAEKASRAKTQFLANMSHEIRTPLGVIQGFADLLHEHPGIPSDQQRWVQTIRRNTRLLTSVIGEILDLSKVEADMLEIESISFPLRETLDEVESGLKLSAEAKGIELKFLVDENVPLQITSDPTRFRQILINLVGNAIKFTENGAVSVQFSRDPKVVDSSLLRVTVADTGMGMSTEHQKSIFEPFAQGDPSMTRRFGGTGLGLAISKKLAKAMQGDLILLESIPGKGTKFELTLCCLDGESVVSKQPNDSKQNYVQTKLEGKKVLLVDDSPDNRFLIRKLFSGSGVELVTADNGREGFEKVMEQEFDLVLLDIQMPEMDGYATLAALQKEGVQIPIVALTAHALRDEQERALKAGFADYLTKPITKATLLQKIETILTRV